MKKCITFFLIFFSLNLPANESIKQTLLDKQKALTETLTDKQKSQILYELALAYHQDQETDKAFYHFLEALKYLQKKPFLAMDSAEILHYTKALEDYQASAGKDPVHIAAELLQKYGEIARQNPDFIHLNFLMATAYANLGRYDDFFSQFYRGFTFLHDTFLAYKTQGILYLRLSHHGKSPEERWHFQQEAFQNLTLALARNPQDSTLYKVLIFLAKDEKNEGRIRTYLQNIVDNQVVLPRCDIYLYVKEAVTLQEFQLGQEIINQAKSQYAFSRAIAEAQAYLDQNTHAR